jgi:DHA1 family inner membrane transport protein
MFSPSRFVLSVRPKATPALLVAAASIALHFAATPFLLPAISDRYGIALGTAGFISVSQVGGFTVANLVAGRRLRPRRAILVTSAIVGCVANAASALTIGFPFLLTMRAVAGVAAGMITWLAWTEAMRDAGALRDVAGVGPFTAFLGSPVVAWMVTIGDERAVFLALAVSTLPAVFMRTAFTDEPLPARRRMSPSRSNVVLLIALGILTGAGSSLYIFAASIGQERFGLASVAVSLAFSLNALAGLAATRQSARERSAPIWLGLIALSAGVVASGVHAIAFYVAMALWGYAFWMAVPVVLSHVAQWSLAPEERTGDAQAIMALGRVLGPAAGAALLGLGSFAAVGIGSASGLAVSAVLVGGVDRYRARNPDRRPVRATR